MSASRPNGFVPISRLQPGETGSNQAADRVDADALQPILPAMIDALSDAVVVIDHEHRVVAANRRYFEVFGLRRDAVVGIECAHALNCPERGGSGTEDGCMACRAFSEGQVQRAIRNLPDATGVQRRWEATFNPIAGASGDVTHVVEVWRDITERSQLESQVSHNERLASLGILAAGVGHEINNPLASMMAGVESLTRWLARRDFGKEGVAEAEEILQTLDREVGRCRETTDKLMLLAQPFSTAPSWVDLNKVVRDTISLLRYQARRQSVEMVEELDPALPQLWAKDTGMRSVVMNLMMNAVQAMVNGGALRVTTARNGDTVRVTVEDNGPGIPPQIMERMWDPFFTTKPLGKGTGLGLAITNRIVTRHGGTIQVESEVGRGAKFTVELPMAGQGGGDV
jgi:PAS domain S-box-containing protein